MLVGGDVDGDSSHHLLALDLARRLLRTLSAPRPLTPEKSNLALVLGLDRGLVVLADRTVDLKNLLEVGKQGVEVEGAKRVGGQEVGHSDNEAAHLRTSLADLGRSGQRGADDVVDTDPRTPHEPHPTPKVPIFSAWVVFRIGDVHDGIDVGKDPPGGVAVELWSRKLATILGGVLVALEGPDLVVGVDRYEEIVDLRRCRGGQKTDGKGTLATGSDGRVHAAK